MRILIAILAFAGLLVSCFALREHFRTEPSPCSINERWDCGWSTTVRLQKSPASRGRLRYRGLRRNCGLCPGTALVDVLLLTTGAVAFRSIDLHRSSSSGDVLHLVRDFGGYHHLD